MQYAAAVPDPHGGHALHGVHEHLHRRRRCAPTTTRATQCWSPSARTCSTSSATASRSSASSAARSWGSSASPSRASSAAASPASPSGSSSTTAPTCAFAPVDFVSISWPGPAHPAHRPSRRGRAAVLLDCLHAWSRPSSRGWAAESLAIQSYALQIQRFAMLFSFSIGLGTEIMIGHLVGAGLFEEAYHRLLASLRTGPAHRHLRHGGRRRASRPFLLIALHARRRDHRRGALLLRIAVISSPAASST